MTSVGRRASFLATAVSLALLSIFPAEAVAEDPGDPPGFLAVSVVLVTWGLEVTPVAGHPLLVRPEGNKGMEGAVVLTDSGGDARLQLPPGAYRLISKKGIPWGRSYLAWDVEAEVTGGQTRSVLLSNDAPMLERLRAGGIDTEAALFKEARNAVFEVQADFGHGTGFLIDSSGLIITSEHVVRHPRKVAVSIDSRSRYPAKIVTRDQFHDVIFLKVHPDAVQGIRPIPLLKGASDAVTAGQRVVGFRRPYGRLAGLTTGSIVYVGAENFLTDLGLVEGDSGGPLLSLQGHLVGVNAFVVRGPEGREASGSKRLMSFEHSVESALKRSRQVPAPPPTRLPVDPDELYPLESLRTYREAPLKGRKYMMKAGEYWVVFMTPGLRHSNAIRALQRAGATVEDERYIVWAAGLGEYRPVVTVLAHPTASYKFDFAKSKLRFDSSFTTMTLTSDGEEVLPLRTNKVCEATIINLEGKVLSRACSGAHDFPPEIFAPDAVIQLTVEGGSPARKVKPARVPRRILERIRDEFDGLRTSRSEAR